MRSAHSLIAILVLNNDHDRARTREVVLKLRHRSPDPVKRARGHHAQARTLIWPVNPDTMLLKHAAQHQSIPERGALERHRHIHHYKTLTGPARLNPRPHKAPFWLPHGQGSPASGCAVQLAVFCNAAPGCRSVSYRPRCERQR